MKKLKPEQIKVIKREIKLELARKDFWEFCRLIDPKFYKKNRKYLRELCSKLQAFYESDKKALIVNMPPRHGKSYTIQLFCAWVFGKNINERIMTASYNERLAINFARFVRDTILKTKAEESLIIYRDIFPKKFLPRFP